MSSSDSFLSSESDDAHQRQTWVHQATDMLRKQNKEAFDDEILALESIFLDDLRKWERSTSLATTESSSSFPAALDTIMFNQIFHTESTTNAFPPPVYENDDTVYYIRIYPELPEPLTFVIIDTEQDQTNLQSLAFTAFTTSVPNTLHSDNTNEDPTLLYTTTASVRLRSFTLTSLPPITLSWSPTESYPSHTVPNFSLSVVYFPQPLVHRLQRYLVHELYTTNHHNVCIFEWVEWLKTQSISYLLSLKDDHSTIRTGCPSFSSLSSIIRLPCTNLVTIPTIDNVQRLHPLPNLSRISKDNPGQRIPCVVLGGSNEWQPGIAVHYRTSYDQQPTVVLSPRLHASSPLRLFHDLWHQYYQSSSSSSSTPMTAHHLLDTYIHQLLQWEMHYEEYLWNTSIQSCRVCFNDLNGKKCMRLYSCQHIFCRECIANYIDARIDSGDIANIICLDPECAKPIAQKDIRDILIVPLSSSSSSSTTTNDTPASAATSEKYTRYETLLLQRAFDTMSDVTYCPLPSCGKPAFLEDAGIIDTGNWFGSANRHKIRKQALYNSGSSGSNTGDPSSEANNNAQNTKLIFHKPSTLAIDTSIVGSINLTDSPTSSSSSSSSSTASSPVSSMLRRKLGRCSYCDYTFCETCRKPWHGLSPCNDFVTKFMNADEEGKEELKKKYGTGVFMELESQLWLNENSKPCLQCNTRIQKNRGCNHMTCRVCKFEWCWVCGGPYIPGHFTSGKCEQFDDEYFADLRMSRAEYYHYFG